MRKKPYEIIEHTADFGIRVRGKYLEDLFVNAAKSLFQIIAERKSSKAGRDKRLRIKISAEDSEELFINWLNELLSLSAVKGLIFNHFKINKLESCVLQAQVSGSSVDNYRINTEVKAATYHKLKIEKGVSGWQAEVIFDV